MNEPENPPAFPIDANQYGWTFRNDEYLQMVPRKSPRQTGQNLSVREALPIPDDALQGSRRWKIRSGILRTGKLAVRAGQDALPRVPQENELAVSGRPRHRAIASARQGGRASVAVPILQHAARRNAERPILFAQGRRAMVSVLRTHPARVRVLQGQPPIQTNQNLLSGLLTRKAR